MLRTLRRGKTALKRRNAYSTFGRMLDDRSYMRDAPHRSMWTANVLLMVSLVVCFALQTIVQFYVGWPVGYYLALSTEGLQQGFVWQLITFQFLHGGLGHLFGNLIGLFFFGRP